MPVNRGSAELMHYSKLMHKETSNNLCHVEGAASNTTANIQHMFTFLQIKHFHKFLQQKTQSITKPMSYKMQTKQNLLKQVTSIANQIVELWQGKSKYLGSLSAASADERATEDFLVAENAVLRVLLCVEELLERSIAVIVRGADAYLLDEPADLVAVAFQLYTPSDHLHFNIRENYGKTCCNMFQKSIVSIILLKVKHFYTWT